MMGLKVTVLYAALWAGFVWGQDPADVLMIQPSDNNIDAVPQYNRALAQGLTVDVVTTEVWKTMTTEQFAAYKALIVQPWGSGSRGYGTASPSLDFLVDSKAAWGPALQGPVVLSGAPIAAFITRNSEDPVSNAAIRVIDNSISFVARGSQTGFFMQGVGFDFRPGATEGTTLGFLDVFGDVSMRANQFTEDVHIVEINHPVAAGLTDASVSSWGTSTHSIWARFPESFRAIMICPDFNSGNGFQIFPDGSQGIAHTIARFAAGPICGDGRLDPDEECDQAELNGATESLCNADCTCTYGLEGSSCAPAPSCGDGRLNADDGEQCDDGSDNGAEDSTCSSLCQCIYGLDGSSCAPAPFCGDGKITIGELCDDGSDNGMGSSFCDSNCQCRYRLVGNTCGPAPSCGDGAVDADSDEECDPASTGNGGANCSQECKCLYGVSTDGPAPCLPPPSCGDNVRNTPEEQCDNGDDNNNTANPCTPSCVCRYGLADDGESCAGSPTCGDGVIGFEEQCDDGASNGSGASLCSPSCQCVYGLGPDGTQCASEATTSQSSSLINLSTSSASTDLNPASSTGEFETSAVSASFAASPSIPISLPSGITTVPPSTATGRIGVEFIYFVEEIAATPIVKRQQEDTATRFLFSRDVFQRALPGRPFFPAVIGFAVSPAIETIYTTSTISAVPDATPTFTFQLCDDCAATVTIAPVPGYTPGVCNGCVLVSVYDDPQMTAAPGGGGTIGGGTVSAGTVGGVFTTVIVTETVYGNASYTSCIEKERTFTIPPEWCTTYTSTLDDGRLTTCTEARPEWTPPASHVGSSGQGSHSSGFYGQALPDTSKAQGTKPEPVSGHGAGAGFVMPGPNGQDGSNRAGDELEAGENVGAGQAGQVTAGFADDDSASRAGNQTSGSPEDRIGGHVQVAAAFKLGENLVTALLIVFAGLFM